MIVGVAQIVFNVADLDRTCGPYLDAGWQETFRVEGLANHRAKAALQASERSVLDMVHLTPPAGTALEVTSYGGEGPAGETVYEFEGHLRVRVVEPQRSRAFWQALGFSEQGDGLLAARAMLPSWQLKVELQAGEGARPATSVDADGCVLVTVLTTAIEPELERLKHTDLLLRFTPSWSEQIGNRTAVVAIVEGPSGELVELLEAPRRSESDE